MSEVNKLSELTAREIYERMPLRLRRASFVGIGGHTLTKNMRDLRDLGLVNVYKAGGGWVWDRTTLGREVMKIIKEESDAERRKHQILIYVDKSIVLDLA